METPIRIVVIGTRGIPEIQGGVETHCQQLYPRIAAMGHDITVIRRTPYVTADNRADSYKGVRLVDVYAPRRKSLEAIVHTTLAVLKARTMHPDILHVHAVGPSIVIPLARLLGMRVVMTNHGPDYDRQKWGRLAKTVIKTGERWGTRFSNSVIVISRVIADILRRQYGRTDVSLIYNGVNPAEKDPSTDYIRQIGAEPGRYILAVGRLVKEKGFHDLIEAYRTHLAASGYKLVIAGDADHPDEYSTSLKADAADAGVIMTGFVRGHKLRQLLTHTALFVMPSYHEGLPIALLEAMSYDLDVAVSSIPANRLDTLDATADFFPPGDTDAMARVIATKLQGCDGTPRRRKYDLTPYNWDNIARATVDVYRATLRPR